MAGRDDPGGESRDLLAAYARTRLVVRDAAARLDFELHPEPVGRFGAWPFPEATAAAVVTAWHPRSDSTRDPARNRADMEELRGLVVRSGFRAIDCVGVGAATDSDAARAGTSDAGAETWSEPSLLVPGVARGTACAWAARFEQNAIFWWTPAEWRVAGVLLAMDDVVLGWRISHGPGRA